MKLLKKLQNAKDIIQSEASEYNETKDLTAEEYASRYGYEKIYKYILRKVFEQYSQNEEIELPIIQIPYIVNKDKSITFQEPEFGAREKYDFTIIKRLFAKAEMNVYSTESDNGLVMNFEEAKPLNIPNPEDVLDNVSSHLHNVAENKDVYLAQAGALVKMAGKTVGSVTKKTLRNLADAAEKHL